MRMLLGFAVAAAVAMPATVVEARDWPASPGIGATSQFVDSNRMSVRSFNDREGRYDRRGRRSGTVVIGDLGYYGGEWALHNNRSWESDSYNDWWHDRPERAYPRWMATNQDCQRQWWSGGGWRC